MTTLKKKKIEELKDCESRKFFYEEHIESGLPIQIRELRKKRKLTQVKLAELMECDQSNVSDWENPNYQYTPQISTLKRLANAFDVPLIVRFGSWAELIDWDSSLSSEKIAPVTYDEFIEKLGKVEKPKPSAESRTTPFRVVKSKEPIIVSTMPELPFRNLELAYSQPRITTKKNSLSLSEDEKIKPNSTLKPLYSVATGT